MEPPYLVVRMACGLCHISFNPTKPPKDPASPKWENIVSNIGNQYFREGMMVGGLGTPTNTLHLPVPVPSEIRSTSETSRYPASHDFINNPVIINSIYRLEGEIEARQTRAHHARSA